jgi:hypothetical protein
MNIPGFDAEASLSPPRHSYRAPPTVAPLSGSGSVTPQIGWSLGSRPHCLWRRGQQAGAGRFQP